MKKIILTVILLGCMVLGLVGCSGTSDSIKEQIKDDVVVQDELKNNESVVSNDYHSFEFICDGVKITLPCTYEEFHEKTKLIPKYKDIEVNHQSVVYQTYAYSTDNEPSLSLYLRNETGVEATYNTCSIIGIGQYETQAKNSGIYIVFPGNLTVGQEITLNELVSIFGEEDDVHVAEGAYTQYHWYINKVPNTGLTIKTIINHKGRECIDSISLLKK